MSNSIQDENLKEYYSKRAAEYESVYNKPIPKRLEEQNYIKSYIEKNFADLDVLELACGTGYWTGSLLKTAAKILAIDASGEMLRIAGDRFAVDPKIRFQFGDAYNPPINFPPFTGCMGNFWFSHIAKSRIESFLMSLHSRLAKNGLILFVDDVFREEQGGELITKKEEEDTYKMRKLENGEMYEILKNYYAKEELESIFGKYRKKVEVQYLNYFWLASYRI